MEIGSLSQSRRETRERGGGLLSGENEAAGLAPGLGAGGPA
jgi:hypothetical protein